MDIRYKNVRLSLGFILAATVLVFLDCDGIIFAVIFAVLAHEGGHLIALRVCGGKPSTMHIVATGIEMSYYGILSYKQDIVIAVAGPLASVILALCASFYAQQFDSEWAYILSGVSLVFCLFNLLPSLPLDGGRILYMVLSSVSGVFTAERVSCIVSCIVIFLLMVLGTALLIYSQKNFTLLAFAMWMLISYCKGGLNGIK